MWKQGADGCIFNPSVACKGDTVPNQPNTVSKIIPKGSIDERVEEFIAQHFPHVVAGKGVLIAQKRCTPQFIETNLVMTDNIRRSTDSPCKALNVSNPEAYTNFVYEQYDGTFYDSVENLSLQETLKLLRRALNAAVALVPDSGPWVIGLDFWTPNVFVKTGVEPFSSLADWGRTLIIENPHDFASIQEGLRYTFNDLKKVGLVSATFLNYAEGPQADYDQFGVVIRKAMNDIVATKQTDLLTAELARKFIENRNTIRVNSIYGILRSCKSYTKMYTMPTINTLLNELLQTTSQTSIIITLNKYLGKDYIDLNTFFPKPSTSSPTTSQSTAQTTATVSPLKLTTEPITTFPPLTLPNPNPKTPTWRNKLFGRKGGKRKSRKALKKSKKRKTRR